MAIGQSRTLLRISSGAKSRRVSTFPASMPTTCSPPCASGSTATPPAAPRPMTTMSVSGCLVAMLVLLVRVGARGRLVEAVEVVRGAMIRSQLVFLHLLLIGWRDHGPHARIPEQIPAHEVHVAAVVRVAECTLPRMAPHHVEEGRRA